MMRTVSGKFHELLLKSEGVEATGFALFDKLRAVIWQKWTNHDPIKYDHHQLMITIS